MLCDSNNSCVMAMAIATANADGSSVFLGLIDDQGGFDSVSGSCSLSEKQVFVRLGVYGGLA